MPCKVTRQFTLWVDKKLLGDTEETAKLVSMYENAAAKHNDSVRYTKYPDAGFDIITPFGDGIVEKSGYVVDGKHSQLKLNTGVRCAMESFEGTYDDPEESVRWAESFYLFPRSSTSKTMCRLANSVGIIDSGYRGQLIAVFDILSHSIQSNETNDIQPYSRMVQVCCGDLRPFLVKVNVVDGDEVERIIYSTTRGEGGFGSTGI